jgi:hypothetical protein
MNTQSTLVIVVGFAYMLQNISKILKFKAEGTNYAYLFSYQSKLRDKYLGNLMQFVLEGSTSPEDEWLRQQALRYAQNPIVKREEFFDLCPQYFSIQKKILEEESFNYSTLTQEGKTLGEDICRDHFIFFQKLVATVCHKQSHGSPESSCGIIFTSHE